MLNFQELERVEWRVLGALRVVDATTDTPIEQNLRVEAAGAKFIRNRSGLYVICHWDALAGHASQFAAQPANPPLGSLNLVFRISDPAGVYLPVESSIALPRQADPAQANALFSLFRPLEVPLYPSPTATTGGNWAVLWVSVRDSNTGDALGGAMLRVRANGRTLARGLTDWRGEAMVPVAGVPVTTFSDDANAVVVSEIAATLQVFFDPASGMRTAQSAVALGRPPPKLPVVNPIALEAARNQLPHTEQNLMIAARRTQSLTMSLALP